jgi:hypothetical protein
VLSQLVAFAFDVLVAQVAGAPQSAPAVVATIDGRPLDAAAFARFVLVERGSSGAGADSLDHLVQQKLVDLECRRRGIAVTERDVEARLARLEKETRKETEGKLGLDDVLAAQKVDRARFVAQLPAAIACEYMMCDDYGLARDSKVPPEKQSLWFQDLRTRHAVEVDKAKLPAGVAAQLGDGEKDGATIGRTEWGLALFQSLGAKEADTLFDTFVDVQLVLAEGVRRGVEVTPKQLQNEVDARTKALVQKLKESGQPADGVDYRSILSSRGEDPDEVIHGDHFKAEIVLKELAREKFGADAYRKYYADHRAEFDRQFGRRVRIATIFLRAAPQKTAKVTRTWTEAQDELEALGKKLLHGDVPLAEGFASEARLHSEHAASAKLGGDLGLLTQAQLEQVGLTADLKLLDQRKGALVGPVTTPDGVHLLLVGESKGASPFEEIADQVEAAARRELLAELRKAAKVERKI